MGERGGVRMLKGFDDYFSAVLWKGVEILLEFSSGMFSGYDLLRLNVVK